jgi:RNA polymerase sigma-70 factor (ECF subfamily)
VSTYALSTLDHTFARPGAWGCARRLAIRGAPRLTLERRSRTEALAVAPHAREVDVVEAARRGDRDAFARLYESYAPVVHGLLLTRTRRTDVIDLVHDVFVSALRRIESLESPESFGPWLCTIARNLAKDAHKKRRDAVELDEDARAAETRDDGDAEEAARALEAVRALPEAYRETLMLRLVEGLNGPEIAERTGLTPGSVRVNLCRGMKLLRERLESRSA